MANAIERIDVKKALLKRKVHLWEPPFFVNDKVVDDELRKLADSLSEELQRSSDSILSALLELQSMSVANARSRKLFEEQRIATLSLRMAQKYLTSGLQETDKVHLEISVLETGAALKQAVANRLDIRDPRKIKCIVRGKKIEDQLQLLSQNVTNGDVVLIIVGAHDEQEASKEEALLAEIQQIKEDSRTVSDSNSFSGHLIQFRNQFGVPVDVPVEQRQALVSAMTLYESGRSKLKEQNYTDALLFLLESDAEFKQVNYSLLDTVDNYALLNLDIVWCYLCLRSVTALPDAGRRLEMAEKTLLKAYGSNFERVQALKEQAGGERANMLRLHLMQGILEFHKGDFLRAEALLREVKEEMVRLKPSDELISQMVALGYSAFEARLALRASGNDLSKAVEHVDAMQKKKREMREKRLQEELKRRLELDLGHMPGGSTRVSVEVFEQLTRMGYTKQQARLGLVKGGNTLAGALDALASRGPLQNPEVERMCRDLGFLPVEVEHALQATANDVRLATDLLLQGKFATWRGDVRVTNGNEISISSSVSEASVGTASVSSILSAASDTTGDDGLARSVLADEALERLAPTMSAHADEYLDFSLDLEEKFLTDYLELLERPRC